MKKHLFLILISMTIFGQAFAQKEIDELQQLMNIVSSLRHSNERTWNKALESFQSDSLWTMMDEIERDDNECWLVGKRQFKLNPILNRCSGYDQKVVRGDFLNGNSPNYNYSLIERSVKKGCSVSYEMSYREGKQIFVVMPYEKNKGSLQVKAFLNGRTTGMSFSDKDGNLILSINEDIKLSDTIRLVISNFSDSNMPFVIINYNSRNYK